MLATLNPRKPAWIVARGGVRLRHCTRPKISTDAFGQALGNSIADGMGSSSTQALSDATYSLPEFSSGGGLGMRLGGGAGLAYGGSRASGSAFDNVASKSSSGDLSESAVNDILGSLGRPTGNGNWGGAEPMVLAAGEGFSPAVGARTSASSNADTEARRNYLNRNDDKLRAWVDDQFSKGQLVTAAPAAIASTSRVTVAKNYDAVVGESWSDFKAPTRAGLDETALRDGGGVVTMAASVIYAASEIGYKVIDGGLALGRVGASTWDSVRGGTLEQDFVNYIGAPALQFSKQMLNSDTYRISGSFKNTMSDSNEEYKVMLGTDRVGFQYKIPGTIAESVNRFTYRWGDAGWTDEMMVEKNFGKIPLLPSATAYGMPISIDAVPGARQNISGNRAITPSMNFDLNIGEKTSPYKFKLSVEFRKSGS